jgi:hypothetical protein
VDFRAFYCAGQALRTGGDPYRLEPTKSCQVATLTENGLSGNGRTLPAPFPPYGLSFFALISLLPIRAATQAWLAASVLALCCSALLVGRLSSLNITAVTLALLGSVGFASLVIGQVVPIVFCAAVFAAVRARHGDGRGAALGAAVAALEPHMALPLWLGLFAGVPAARRSLLVAAAALVAISLLAGPALSLEYFRQVLPLHARSELYNFSAQYSAAALAAVAGIAPNIDAAIGLGSYAIMLVLGIVVGMRLARRHDDPAFAAVTPMAAALLGGEFLHITQIALALPFALILYARLPRRSLVSAGVLVAIVALAVPWETIAELPIVWDRHPMSHAVGRRPVLQPAAPADSVEVSYGQYIDAFAERIDPRSIPEQLAWKLPTWLGLGFVLCVGLSASGALTGVSRKALYRRRLVTRA